MPSEQHNYISIPDMLTFLNHQFLAFRRSKSQAGNIAARIVMYLFALYFALMAIGAGLYMEKLIQSVFPDENVLDVFNGFILYYFLADFVMRIQLQELPVLSVVPYLHLNISRKKIVNYLNIKGFLSAFNIFPLFLFLPFILTNISHAFGSFTAGMFALGILSLVVFNNYLALYVKRKSISNFTFLLTGILIIAFLIALDYFKVISTTEISKGMFNAILERPILAFGFTLLAAAIYAINSNYLSANLYIEELSRKEANKVSTDYPFLNRFGKVGELAALELKLILRHKRSRTAMYTGLLFLPYGLIFYKDALIENNQFGSMLFAAIFVTGLSILLYGQLMFAWQSTHFDGLLANKIDLKNFIQAKFLLLTLSSTVVILLGTFYGFVSWKLLLLHLAAYLYNIGFGTVIVLWFATKNYKRLDLSSGSSFNWQGVGATQWIMSIPIIVIPFALYFPFYLIDQPFWGLWAIALFGLITLLMRNFWINLLTKTLIKQRYKIAEGFRE